jgi:chaperonin GroEL (HSP60 family)
VLETRLTNDGNAILREIDVAHPAAKNMIELSRTQDEECGDGTTSVIILGMRLVLIVLANRLLIFASSWRDLSSILIPTRT